MKKQYLTTDQRARRVLNCCGRAPAVLASMADEHKHRIASLCDAGGQLQAGAMDALRLVLIDHYEQKKATSDETDPLPNSESET